MIPTEEKVPAPGKVLIHPLPAAPTRAARQAAGTRAARAIAAAVRTAWAVAQVPAVAAAPMAWVAAQVPTAATGKAPASRAMAVLRRAAPARVTKASSEATGAAEIKNAAAASMDRARAMASKAARDRAVANGIKATIAKSAMACRAIEIILIRAVIPGARAVAPRAVDLKAAAQETWAARVAIITDKAPTGTKAMAQTGAQGSKTREVLNPGVDLARAAWATRACLADMAKAPGIASMEEVLDRLRDNGVIRTATETATKDIVAIALVPAMIPVATEI